MKYLIVNADDFGLTAGVNRAVIEAHTRGILTSTTIMANMPAFDEAAQLAKEHPSLGVGLHFNITQGRPVAPASEVSSLLNAQGEFPETSTALLRRALTGNLKISQIELELRAQIERVLNAGLRLTHIDSHKHSHALPPVCETITRVIGDYGIKAVRLPRERWRFPGLDSTAKQITQSLAAFGLAQLCRVGESALRKSGVKTPDSFLGVSQTGFWTKRWLLELIESLPAGVSELMSHPGYDDQELGRIKTRLRASRQSEFQLLIDGKVIAAIRQSNVKLITYAQLSDPDSMGLGNIKS
ncbi:MAG: carbohydrate deacetylase [Blastocatellales bacterium]